MKDAGCAGIKGTRAGKDYESSGSVNVNGMETEMNADNEEFW